MFPSGCYKTIFVFCSSGERTETDQRTSINLLPSLPLVDKGTPQTPSPWRSNRNPDLKRGGWWLRSAPDRRPISYKKIKDQIEKMFYQISSMPSDKTSNQTENQNAKNGEIFTSDKFRGWRLVRFWWLNPAGGLTVELLLALDTGGILPDIAVPRTSELQLDGSGTKRLRSTADGGTKSE